MQAAANAALVTVGFFAAGLPPWAVLRKAAALVLAMTAATLVSVGTPGEIEAASAAALASAVVLAVSGARGAVEAAAAMLLVGGGSLASIGPTAAIRTAGTVAAGAGLEWVISCGLASLPGAGLDRWPGHATAVVASAFDFALYAALARPVSRSADDRSVVTRGGRLRYRQCGSAAATKRDALVVVVPDGPSDATMYDGLAKRIAEGRGIGRVVVLDMPGMGLSRAAASYTHGLLEGAGALGDAIAALRGGAGQRTVVVASCLNGLYALALARQEREDAPVSGLVLSQTPSAPHMRAWAERTVPLTVHVPVLGQAVLFATGRAAARAWVRRALPDRRPDLHPLQEPVRAAAGRTMDAGGCFCLAGVVQGGMRSTDPEAPEADLAVPPSVPVEILWGAMDRSHGTTPPGSLSAVVPHAIVTVLDDVGHMPDLEDPDSLLESLGRVMESLHLAQERRSRESADATRVSEGRSGRRRKR